jgi:hypothetical protein
MSTAAVQTVNDESQLATPKACLSRIAQVRRRWAWLRRTLAVSTLAVWLTGTLTAAVLLDAWIRGPRWWRALLLAMLGTSIALVLRRSIITLWKSLSFDSAALLIEKTYPDLRGRLVTAVQLADASRRAGSGVSADLYGRVRAAAETTAPQLAPKTVVPGKSIVKKCAAAWVGVAMVLAVAGFNRESASIGIRRVLLPWAQVNWPKRTYIHVSSLSERVVRGGTLILIGRVTGTVPSSGTLCVRAGRSPADRAYFEIEQTGDFRVQYRPVMQDLEVWLEIGDNATSPSRVVMIPPPEIVAIRTECTLPEYTRLPPHQIEDGNVQAIFGTQLRLVVTASKAITDGRLAWEDGTSAQMTLTPVPGAEATFVVRNSQSYRVHLTDADGFHNPDPVIYRIEMTDNQYPQFDRVMPSIDRRATPTAVLPISAEIGDDYGAAMVTLLYRKGAATDTGRIELPLSKSGKRAAVQYHWQLEPLDVKPGDSLTWWLEARDEGEHAAQHDWPVSRPRRVKIMSEVELARALSDELEQLMDKLSQLESLQAECAEAVGRIASAEQPGQSTAVQERTRAEKWRQDRLARTAGQLAESIGRVADDYAASRIGQQERWLRLQSTAERLARLGGTDMPAIVLALEDALNSIRGEQPSATQPTEAR